MQCRLCSYTKSLLQALRKKADEDGCEVIIVSAQVSFRSAVAHPACSHGSLPVRAHNYVLCHSVCGGTLMQSFQNWCHRL